MKKSFFTFFLILIILINIFSNEIFSPKVFDDKFFITLKYLPLKKSSENNGKIYIRNILNLREEKKGKDDLNHIGNLRGSYGVPFPILSNVNIDEVFKNFFRDILNYSGYEVVDNQQEDAKILDLELKTFNMDGYMVYRLTLICDIKLYSSDGEKILFQGNIDIKTAFLPKQKGMKIFDMKQRLMAYLVNIEESYQRLLNSVAKQLIWIFNSEKFYESYNNNVFHEEENLVNYAKMELKSIPNDIKDSENVSKISFYNNSIDKIENLDNLKNLKELDLIFNKLKKIENLENNNELEVLLLSANSINKIEGLDNLIKLEDLDLNDNMIKSIENIGHLNKLKWLTISDNFIKEIKNIDNCEMLEFLHLAFNIIKKIENLDKLNNLIFLNLSGNNINKIENLDKLNNLIFLALSTNQIKSIENLEKLVELKSLDLSNNEGIKKIENLNNLINLEILNLSNTSVKKIENLEKLSNLKELNIYNTKISRLENLENFKSLERIIISTNDILNMSKETYEFLKNNKWTLDGMEVDEFLKKKFIKVK